MRTEVEAQPHHMPILRRAVVPAVLRPRRPILHDPDEFLAIKDRLIAAGHPISSGERLSTDLRSVAAEHVEHVEHQQHAAHSPFDRRVAMTMAIVAAMLAAVTAVTVRWQRRR